MRITRRRARVSLLLGFTALAVCADPGPKPAVAVVVVQGNAQTAAVGTNVPIVPTIKVVDEDGVGVGGGTYHFTVISGGGTVGVCGTVGCPSVEGTVGSDGTATPGSWRLGPQAGPNLLYATVDGVGSTLEFTATGTAGPATQHIVNAGQNQTAVINTAVPVPPSVKVMDVSGNAVAGATVTFSVSTGGGSVTGATATSNASGIATVGSWTLGPTAGPQKLAAKLDATGTVVFFDATAQGNTTFNLTIDGMYLTQATQSYTGTVPLVADKPALLRVFVKASGPNTATPTVKVYRYGYQPLAGFDLLYNTYTITAPGNSVPQTIDEANLNSSWNMVIPASEIGFLTRILVEVDPDNTIAEFSETDNKFPASGVPKNPDVRAVSTLKMTFFPVAQPSGTGDVSLSNVASYLEFAKRVYPLKDVEAIIGPTYTYGTNLSSSYDATWSTLLSEIAAKRTADGVTNRYYYAVIKPNYSAGATVQAQTGGAAAVGVDVKFNSTVNPSSTLYATALAHGLGHNFGRQDVNCGSPPNPDLQYPYGPAGGVGVYGWDSGYNVLRGKNDYVDVMTHCQPPWISDYTYKAVMAWRATHFAQAPAVAGRALLVWGRMGPTGIVLEPAFEVDAPITLPTSAGRYSVEAVDAGGRQLFKLSFDGYETGHATGDRNFAFTVPLPKNEIAELRLLDGSRVVARRSRASQMSTHPADAAGSARMRSLGGPRSRLEWNAQTFPMAMVRDPVTGEVLGFLRGGAADLGTQRSEVDVLFSNGVASVKQRLQIAPH